MVTQFNRENYVKNLPDAYRKTKGSNNDKILAIEKSSLDDLRASIRAVYDSLDLDQATGKTLDLYGEMVGQERGKANDEQYRVMIKSRIIRNRSNGDYNSVARAIALIFDCEPSDFVLAEYEDEGSVELKGLPFEILNSKGIDNNTAVKIISKLVPAGIRFESIAFEGTFEFSGEELIYDEAAGFGNEEQTIGGSLGLLANGEYSDLPV